MRSTVSRVLNKPRTEWSGPSRRGRATPTAIRALLTLFLVMLGFLGLQIFPSVHSDGKPPVLALLFGLFCVVAALVSALRAR